jgi:hypothetical protein
VKTDFSNTLFKSYTFFISLIMKLNACGVFWMIRVTRHRSGWLHGGLLTIGLKAAEAAETLPDDGKVAPAAYRAIFWSVEQEGS